MQEPTVKGSIHSHGCWTDYRNRNEQARFPFNLEAFVRHCIAYGRDFQAVTDIMTNHSRSEFKEHRYLALLNTANSHANYDLESGKNESTVYFSGKRFTLLRSQEILTNKPYQHLLVLGVDSDISGGRPAREILKEARDLGAYSIINHPFSCNPWDRDEILSLYDQGLIQAVEWNSGNVLPAFISKFFRIAPSKQANLDVLRLGQETQIPVIANDDSHSSRDIERGAFTSYYVGELNKPLFQMIFDAIKARKFERHETYSPLSAPFWHYLCGKLSQKRLKEQGLPNP